MPLDVAWIVPKDYSNDDEKSKKDNLGKKSSNDDFLAEIEEI